MENKKTKKIYVVGHKNPDTDSICSAIAYADLKSHVTGECYEARRAGRINEETQFVLDHFEVAAPKLLSNVHTQVKDLDINRVDGVKSNISIKEAWALMKKKNTKTMPVLNEGNLEGIITIGDIATSYMDVYDSHILAEAKTKYGNIASTIDGKLLTGNEDDYFGDGKVTIAASSPDLMENFIEPKDLVIAGNRYETQLCALELEASCIVVCGGAAVSRTIKRMAEARNCVMISTPHDTYTVARMINQSIPVKYFMSRSNLSTFYMTDYLEDVKEVMTKKRFRDFPVLDRQEHLVGIISRRRLLDVRKKQVILVDHNEKSQAVDGIEEAEVLEIIDHHRLGSLETVAPVYFRNQPVGCTATIIYQMYQEADVKISETNAALLCAAIISDTLMFRSPTCTIVDKVTAQELAKIADIEIASLANDMFNAGSNLKNKTADEICFQDFKRFDVGGVTFGVGQVNSMNQDELDGIKKVLEPHLKVVLRAQGLDMVYFMLTNIVEESTELLYCGTGAKDQVLDAFDLPEDTEDIILKGVVSRKKQLIPNFVISLQQ